MKTMTVWTLLTFLSSITITLNTAFAASDSPSALALARQDAMQLIQCGQRVEAAGLLLETLRARGQELPPDSVHLRIHAGRPLTNAAITVSENFGQAVSYEEAVYTAEHPLHAIVPGKQPLLPQVVRLSVDYETAVGLEEALGRVIAAAARVLPEPYHIEESDGMFSIVPNATNEPSDSPLDARIHLTGTMSVAEAVDTVIAQVMQVFPDVLISPGTPLLNVHTKVTFPDTTESKSARFYLNQITREWTGGSPARHIPALRSRFITWHLRYGADMSSMVQKKAFNLAFYTLTPATGDELNTFEVESGHPVPDAVDLIEGEFGTPITAEEPPVECACGLMGKRSTPNVGLSGGTIKLRWKNGDTLGEILNSLLDPGRVGDKDGLEFFELIGDPARPALRPVRKQNEAEQIVDYQSFLGMDLTERLKSAPDLLSLEGLAELVSQQSGHPLVAGLGPDAPLDQAIEGLKIQTPRDSVRVTLESLLHGVVGADPADVTFRLLYDPVLEGHRLVAKKLGADTGK